MISELIGKKLKIHAFIDNKNLHSLIHSTTAITEKRLRIEVAAIKEMIHRDEIECINWIKNEDQIADSLTKRGSSCQRLIDILKSGSF